MSRGGPGRRSDGTHGGLVEVAPEAPGPWDSKRDAVRNPGTRRRIRRSSPPRGLREPRKSVKRSRRL
eukprot:9646957-Alexandrium_andersonii.AAC.1